jgi:hypothetical protein
VNLNDFSSAKGLFTSEELKNLFQLNLTTNCETLDLIKLNAEDEFSTSKDFLGWSHYSNADNIEDTCLQNCFKKGKITFIIHCSSKNEK